MGERQLPELYPGWKTVRKIGSGSFGTVYEIERDLFGKIEKAALKFITIPQNDGDVEEMYSNGYDDASITAHFETYLANIVREYSLMVEMKGHTNVVYCDDIRYVPQEDGIGWDITIKMELLTPLIKTLGPDFGEEQVIRLGKDLCRALALCRERDIVHRDIKPQNIFVSKTGDYKLGDFGIAKTVEQTTGGTKIGTYSYMAPEVYHNKPYGSSADIYSLGLVMYWLLNERRLPFLPLPPKSPTYDETENARHRRFMGEDIPAPKKGSDELKKIVLKACAFDPQDRFVSAQEMLDALERIGQADPVVNKVEVREDALQALEEKVLAWSQTTPADTVADKTMGLFITSRPAAEKPAGKEPPAVFIEPVKRETPVVNKPEPVFVPAVQQEKKTAQVFEVKPAAEEKKTEIQSNAVCGSEEPVPSITEMPKLAPQLVEDRPPQKSKLWIFGACAVVVLAVIGFAFYSMYHIWSDPTCTAPATCSICGKILGETLDHQWKNADCYTPRTCMQCGATEGTPVEHDLVNASQGYVFCRKCGDIINGEDNNLSEQTEHPEIVLSDITAIEAGWYHTVALKSDGTVAAVGHNDDGQCNVFEWSDIVEIAAGATYTLGLKSDGTVLVAGRIALNVRNELSAWNDIVAIAANGKYIVGMRSDGSVVAMGENEIKAREVSNWKDIAAVSAGYDFIVGLKLDGTVVQVGGDSYAVSSWNDIAAIDAGINYTVGLRSNGTVRVSQDVDVSEWSEIVSIETGNSFVVGLKSNGTVVVAGYTEKDLSGVSEWYDIVAISAGDGFIVGQKSDGALVAVGDNHFGQCDVYGLNK